MTNLNCPINFGDCNECEFYVARNCEHKFFYNLNKNELKKFINLSNKINFINNIERTLLIDLVNNCVEEEDE